MTDALRPAFHFTPPVGWMNDPNGLIHVDGEYHLFYQFYPHGVVWGPMHWGHAVSRDLLHWQHLPVALEPDDGGYVFSGSVVRDGANRTGLGASGQSPLVALYTAHDPQAKQAGTGRHESQALAYSLDRGRSWQRYIGNPVLPNPGATPDFRDPSVFWHAPSDRWVMALAVNDHVAFHGSADLLHWHPLSRFGAGIGRHDGVWECPNLFPLQVVGSGETRWVLLVSVVDGGPQGGTGTQYFIGDFDGTRFVPDEAFLARIGREDAAWIDHGHDNYAGVTWNDAPDGRRLFIGWMSNWRYATKVPATTWRSAMTLPRELSLLRTEQGLVLASRPLRELGSLHGSVLTLSPMRGGMEQALPEAVAQRGDIQLHFETPPGQAGHVVLELSNAKGERLLAGWDAQRGVFVDRRHAGRADWHPQFAAMASAPLATALGTQGLRLVIDRYSVELFAADGALAMTETFFATTPFTQAVLRVAGGTLLLTGEAAQLREAAAIPVR